MGLILMAVRVRSEYRNAKQVLNFHLLESSVGGPPTGGILQGVCQNNPEKDLNLPTKFEGFVTYFRSWIIRNCFEFRASDFEFNLANLS